MTDVRAILEAEGRRRQSFRTRQRRLAGLLAFGTTVAFLLFLAHKEKLWFVLVSLALTLGHAFAVATFTPRHQQALRDAIADPDPSLDPYFVEPLPSPDPAVAALGREAFVERFASRTPDISVEDWTTVAKALAKAKEAVAGGFLSILARGAPTAAIAPTEAFSNDTKSQRLRTLSLQALGEMRLRIARERIVGHSEAAERNQEDERQRLRL